MSEESIKADWLKEELVKGELIKQKKAVSMAETAFFNDYKF